MAAEHGAARRAQQSLVVHPERAEAVTRVAADTWLRWSVAGAPVPVAELTSPLDGWRTGPVTQGPVVRTRGTVTTYGWADLKPCRTVADPGPPPEWAGELWPLEEAEDGLELSSPDGTLLAVANTLGLYVLDTTTGTRLPADEDEAVDMVAEWCTALAFSSDAGRFAGAQWVQDSWFVTVLDVHGREGGVVQRSVSTLRLGAPRTGGSAVDMLQFAPDGRLLAVTTAGGRPGEWLLLYDTETDEPLGRHLLGERPLRPRGQRADPGLAFTLDNSWLAVAFTDHLRWLPVTGGPAGERRVDGLGQLDSVAPHPDGHGVLAATSSGLFRVMP